MRLLVSIMAAGILAVLVLAGCNSKDKVSSNSNAATPRAANPATPQLPAPTTPSDNARRITTVELNEALSKGEAIVIDVRGPDAFKQKHIKGALQIPLNEIGNRASELPRDKMIVTYCS